MGLFDAVQEYAERVSGSITQVVDDIAAGWEDTAPAGTPTAAYEILGAVRQAIFAGYTVETFTSSGTWTKPAGTITEFWAAGVGGGGKGMPGAAGNSGLRFGGAPGLSGSYEAVQIDPAELGATEPYVVGAAASTNGALGGATSFGTHMATTPGGLGGIATPQGYSQTTSRPGDGGRGGNAESDSGGTNLGYAGDPGGAAALAAGGTAGAGASSGSAGGAGGHGANADLTGPTKSGGGGGGGGGGIGRTVSATITGGQGGNGGYPGGGSGGGGAASVAGNFATAVAGQPGTPANGCLFLIYKLTPP